MSGGDAAVAGLIGVDGEVPAALLAGASLGALREAVAGALAPLGLGVLRVRIDDGGGGLRFLVEGRVVGGSGDADGAGAARAAGAPAARVGEAGAAAPGTNGGRGDAGGEAAAAPEAPAVRRSVPVLVPIPDPTSGAAAPDVPAGGLPLRELLAGADFGLCIRGPDDGDEGGWPGVDLDPEEHLRMVAEAVVGDKLEEVEAGFALRAQDAAGWEPSAAERAEAVRAAVGVAASVYVQQLEVRELPAIAGTFARAVEAFGPAGVRAGEYGRLEEEGVAC